MFQSSNVEELKLHQILDWLQICLSHPTVLAGLGSLCPQGPRHKRDLSHPYKNNTKMSNGHASRILNSTVQKIISWCCILLDEIISQASSLFSIVSALYCDSALDIKLECPHWSQNDQIPWKTYQRRKLERETLETIH